MENTPTLNLEIPDLEDRRGETHLNSLSKKDFKRNLLLLGFTILVMIIFFEIILRMYYPQKLYDDCYEYSYKNLSNLEVELDSHLGWKLIKNYSGCRYQPDTNKIITKTHNSNGLRIDKDISYEKGNKKRVLLLGDSFVYGYGLDDNETIAVKLQEKLGENYEAINMGVDGYGTVQEILQFKEEGLRYNPDIVMLFFYPNDFKETQSADIYFADQPIMYIAEEITVITDTPQENKLLYVADLLRKGSHKLFQDIINPTMNKTYIINNESILIYNYPTKMLWKDKYGPKKKPLSMEKPFSSLLLRYSHFYSLIYHKLTKLNFDLSKKKYADRITDGIDVFIEKEYTHISVDNTLFLAIKLFDELKKTSEEEDFEFIVVGIPEKMGVNEKYQEKFLNQYSDADKSMFEFKKIDRIFGEELLKQDIEYISLYNLAEENFDEFYFESDAHWKPNGVELSADYITEELEKRKII